MKMFIISIVFIVFLLLTIFCQTIAQQNANKIQTKAKLGSDDDVNQTNNLKRAEFQRFEAINLYLSRVTQLYNVLLFSIVFSQDI